MKEIKFRAWDKISRYMEDFDLNRIYWRGEKTGDYYFPGEGIVIMQYTGLLDKNGVEIYEGDRIKYDMYGDGRIIEGVVPVISPESRHWFGELQSLVDDGYYIEVIGNIYQNPELLD